MKHFLVLLLSGFIGHSASALAHDKVTIGVIDGDSKQQFESEVKSQLTQQTRNCSPCEFVNLAVYDEKGQLDMSALPAQIESAQVQILYFTINKKNSAAQAQLVESLKKISDKHVIVVSDAGLAQGNEDTIPLKRTIIAQVPKALIIGELNDRERLSPKSYYGPEMLTALKPARDDMAAPRGLLFTAKLAQNLHKKSADDWYNYLNQVKSTTRKIWPGLDDFFR